ncbi:bifunctional tetrahydrofolate synthase/dihydrofolate synthase [Cupriavidus consociatus]|uniref:bifunctional tetrahydrofolate synthase/dihydrofolate synthase n=1 Tax=Cupriavidus consociatus TaxID=2821357 RepID=UPI001AE4EB26|nr:MULTISPECIES: bifunctional tetrahydrofolate synthase/dihydrofolate synthase [unclassified Cupriavidus]MBP0624323.1 bifunctional tetrahydrofolate synthase/dihydrofolate synthase [Cupriavidus sp. LEh25]MDK2661037.1 bifunctional tetrahydrofolate synthase/dihydrofolate synthase [Cupriavidus sp. LEh21]
MPVFHTLPEWLTHLETGHPVGIDMGLTRITRVKEALGLRIDATVFTVGGTNGKGSTCAMLERILLEAGYKVGCHTSPHLISFNERARLNGEMATDAQLLPHFEAVERARNSFADPVSLTYFEFTTLAIIHFFAASGLDAIILEVGLGGRLDATNVIDTDCAIVTSVDIDHTQYLGNTREEIGFEKAGIFRPGVPAVCGDPVPPKSLVAHAEAIGAELWLVGRDFNFHAAKGQERQQWDWSGGGRKLNGLGYPALRGANQLLNAAAVLAALQAMRPQLPVSAQEVRNGLAFVELPGRFQVLPGRPAVILDVAHNPHAAATLGQNLENMGFFRYTYAVFGAMQDKDIAGVLQHVADKVDHWCLCDLPTERAASAADVLATLEGGGFRAGPDATAACFSSPEAAFRDAMERATENDRILVFGSFYTVAGVMAYRATQAN